MCIYLVPNDYDFILYINSKDELLIHIISILIAIWERDHYLFV